MARMPCSHFFCCFVGALETSAPPLYALFALLVHFLLWQAAKPSGDKCTPFVCVVALLVHLRQVHPLCVRCLLCWCT